jgi:catechol 2,3-dioxygenase-like lactoylglutathione lyase family enzyme
MEPRISIVTLAVDDLDRAARFYESMGLKRNQAITDGVAFFQMGGMILALWPREELAKDSGRPAARSASSTVALAYNTREEGEVASVLAQAETAGGTILRPAAKAFWGGTQGYFEDPDGHVWEVAHNPGFPIDAAGNISLPS